MALHVVNGDPHEKIIEEATQAVLSTIDLALVLERTGALLNRHFGATRVVIHRLDAQPPGQALVLCTDEDAERASALRAAEPVTVRAAPAILPLAIPRTGRPERGPDRESARSTPWQARF